MEIFFFFQFSQVVLTVHQYQEALNCESKLSSPKTQLSQWSTAWIKPKHEVTTSTTLKGHFFYLRADCSLPNKLVVWSILGNFSAGLVPKIPEGLRRICECFLSSSAGLWCDVNGLMRDAAAAPTDWDLNGVLSTWWPRSILMEREFLLDATFWLALFSFP